mgnify:CR=1 FL=1|tara:strand:+ start:97 stop:738 length:642 start_codon:yes stop_codon:yes gene_type:complete
MSPSHKILDLGLSDFNDTWELQKELQTKRILNEIEDHFILVEHPPVYTLGKNAPKEHLLNLVKDVSVVQTDRGGKVTFHGPGQLVGYPILNLNHYKRSITWYMRELEQLIIDILDDYGIIANRKKGLTGVWVKDKKIAALGIRISKWVTMHGFSMNINPDLEYYKTIIPCGIKDYGITSMAQIMGDEVPLMDEIKLKVINLFSRNFKGIKVNG